MCSITKDILFKALEWFLFLGLCIASLYTMWDVLNKFQSQKSNFFQYEEPIKEAPTITICFTPFEKATFNTIVDPSDGFEYILNSKFELGLTGFFLEKSKIFKLNINSNFARAN